MEFFQFYTKEQVLAHTRLRKFETRLGERIQVTGSEEGFEEELNNPATRYIVFGICEDIGVLANDGKPGCAMLWESSFNALCNLQSNDFLDGQEMVLLGHFDFSSLKKLIENNAHDFEEMNAAYRHAVVRIDEAVEKLVKRIAASGKIPIAIGGGQNNAYPLIKGVAKGLAKAGLIPLAQINAVNLDIQSDYLPIEGRHHSNSFRYAEEDGFLQKYCMLGIHESQLPQNVWMDIVNNPFLDMVSSEDIFVHDKRTFRQSIAHAASFVDDGYVGVELDLKSLDAGLAFTHSAGCITIENARQYLSFMGMASQTAYVHLCEGYVNPQFPELAGKLVADLITDFIKASENGEA
jgi:formiminoglutamase